MPIKLRLRQAKSTTSALLRNPAQVRFVPQWLRTLNKSPLDLALPWLPYQVMEMLENHLTPESTVFEFGGGGSTLWLAQRCGELQTVEHDAEWFPALAAATGHLSNVQVRHANGEDEFSEYVGAIDVFPDEHFDAVIVDGRERIRCLEHAMPKVKRGGLLILDDYHRPKYSRASDLMLGWPVLTFSGLTPSKGGSGHTAVWRRAAHG